MHAFFFFSWMRLLAGRIESAQSCWMLHAECTPRRALFSFWQDISRRLTAASGLAVFSSSSLSSWHQVSRSASISKRSKFYLWWFCLFVFDAGKEFPDIAVTSSCWTVSWVKKNQKSWVAVCENKNLPLWPWLAPMAASTRHLDGYVGKVYHINNIEVTVQQVLAEGEKKSPLWNSRFDWLRSQFPVVDVLFPDLIDFSPK